MNETTVIHETTHETTESIGVTPHADPHSSELPGFLTTDLQLMMVTWGCFFILLFLLSKFAWKPILAALDSREQYIKKSVEDADKIKTEMESLAAKQQQIIREAESAAKGIIEDSRKAAKEAANQIAEQAKKEAQIILENAQRDIREEVKEAQARLRQESAEIAVELAAKIIEENLDETKSRKLISQYISEL
ncbi:MAG: F0F1 ATP synthase subunit B [Candidatus Omnitrophica bacterium]|nr:F0F1 ATP synthase subunit B [Candidatus Omnitrophota bacterium]